MGSYDSDWIGRIGRWKLALGWSWAGVLEKSGLLKDWNLPNAEGYEDRGGERRGRQSFPNSIRRHLGICFRILNPTLLHLRTKVVVACSARDQRTWETLLLLWISIHSVLLAQSPSTRHSVSDSFNPFMLGRHRHPPAAPLGLCAEEDTACRFQQSRTDVPSRCPVYSPPRSPRPLIAQLQLSSHHLLRANLFDRSSNAHYASPH